MDAIFILSNHLTFINISCDKGTVTELPKVRNKLTINIIR